MTISNASRTAGPFVGNGIISNFPFTFKVFDRADLLVARTITATGVEAILTLDADYTVSLNSDQNSNPGGVINTTTPLPIGSTLAATSNIAIAQTMDLTNLGGFHPKVINDALDRVVIQIQQLSARLGLGALNVGAAATIAKVLGFIDQFAASAGASLMGFIQAGVGAIARTVQDELRDIVKVSQFSTLQQAVDCAASTKKPLMLDKGIALADLAMVDFFAASDLLIFGPGHVVGPAVAARSQPTAYLKLWGSLGAPVAYPAAIAKAANTFPVAQTFVPGDLVLLSNYPTDATDAYTEGAADIFGDKARTYANFSLANLRQTRRKELLVVATSAAGSFTTTTGAVHAYASTQGLQFQKVTPLRGLRFQGVTFENVHLNLRYTRGVSFEGCTALSTMLVGKTVYNTKLDFPDFDARGTDCRVDFFEKSRTTRVTGTYKNINSPSENAVLKFLGCDDILGQVIVEGCKNSNGLMIDTAFTENPTGYSDLPAANINLTVTARACEGQGVALTCDPFAAKLSNVMVHCNSDDTGVVLKGTDNIDVYFNTAFADGSGNSVYLLGARGTNLFGKQRGGIYSAPITNPRDATQTQATSATSRIGAANTATSQPAWLAYLTAVMTDVTGDGTEVAIPFNSNVYDYNSNHVGGTFTAPYDAVYLFNITLKLNGVGAAHTGCNIRLNADGTNLYAQPSPAAIAAASGDCALSFTTCAFMRAGSTAKLYLKVYGGTKVVDVQGSGLLETFWSGAMLN